MADNTSSALPPPPPTPDPLTPAQTRARRVDKMRLLKQMQEAGDIPIPTRAQRGPVGRALFELEHVQRLPVEVSAAAREVITASSSQGRLFPQALAEVFGEAIRGGTVASLAIDVEEKEQRFAIHPSERHPLTGAGPKLLVVTAEHVNGTEEHRHTWLINAQDLCDLHPITRHVLFNALTCAQELARLYPHWDVPFTPPPPPPPPDRGRRVTRGGGGSGGGKRQARRRDEEVTT